MASVHGECKSNPEEKGNSEDKSISEDKGNLGEIGNPEGNSTEKINTNEKRFMCEFKPCPKWTTKEDFEKHGYKACIWARKIFLLILHLARQRCKIATMWHKPTSMAIENLYQSEGSRVAEHICDVCEAVLDCLTDCN